jgi:hypothetical protein
MESTFSLATGAGLWHIGADGARPVEALHGRSVTAIAREGDRTWAIVDGRSLWTSTTDGDWRATIAIDGPPATCMATTRDGLLIGTEQAHLLRLAGDALVPIASFERVDGRDAWYTPWGDPADVRSITVAPDGAVHVNVHVGGVVRSRDGGVTWTPTVDIERDVHQVLAHGTRPGVVLAAAADGLGVSRDAGESWEFVTAGLHAHYLRAVAVSDDIVLVSASRGHHGRQSAVYRKPLDRESAFARCRDGLPDWFDDNIDTACLAASGPVVVFGTSDGRVFRSDDSGRRWRLVTKGLPQVTGVVAGR